MPRIGPDDVRRAIGQETSREQAQGMEFLDPLAILDVGLLALDILGLPAIDQDDLETKGGQRREQVLPISAGAFHGNGLHPVFLQPEAQLKIVVAIDPELFYVLRILSYRCPMALASDVDPRGIGIDHFQ